MKILKNRQNRAVADKNPKKRKNQYLSRLPVVPLWKIKVKKISVQKASSIVTQQPQSIQSDDQSDEKINPADSASVEIQDVNPEIHEGQVEEAKLEEP